MGPPSYMRSVVDRNVVMRRMAVHWQPYCAPRPTVYEKIKGPYMAPSPGLKVRSMKSGLLGFWTSCIVWYLAKTWQRFGKWGPRHCEVKRLENGYWIASRRKGYWPDKSSHSVPVNLLAPDFFLILAHPVYKMWIIQEPNTLELWNKLHFEKEKTESIYLLTYLFIYSLHGAKSFLRS